MKERKGKPMKYRMNDETALFLVKEAEVTYDANGRKKSVILPYKIFEEMMKAIEDVKDHKLMDEVLGELDISWEVAKKKLKRI